jgi:hypothetical protein
MRSRELPAPTKIVRGALPVLLVLAGLAAARPAAASEWRADWLPVEDSSGLFLDVDCASPSLCVAVGSDDAIASSTDPGGGAAAWRMGHLQEPGSYGNPPGGTTSAVLLPGAQIRGVSCPNTGFCVAVTRLGGIFTTTNPDRGTAAWNGFQLQASGPRTTCTGSPAPRPRCAWRSRWEGRSSPPSTRPAGLRPGAKRAA